MSTVRWAAAIAALVAFSGPAAPAPAAPRVSIRLPQKFRVLESQQFDLRVEATGLADVKASSLSVRFDGVDVTGTLPAPEVSSDNDADAADLDKAWTFRRVSLATPGRTTVEARVADGEASASDSRDVGVFAFDLEKKPKSVVLFLGDGMGTAYRDAARLVAKSVGGHFREGFFDALQAMDEMPVSGMVMTYAMDRVVPDSANTATAWASGNKTVDGALNAFPDDDDFRYFADPRQATKAFALDNPRVETLWEYLRRRHGYATGIVTTADVTDATPAGEGAHSISRTLAFDIARQFVDGAFVPGPAFDVILGGGAERFTSRTPENNGDARDLAAELRSAGYAYVRTRTELDALPAGTRKVLGLFRTGNMNVAYDKLRLARPPDEPTPGLGAFTDQPFLDEMTRKALNALSADGRPFILMVEGASIDKQSHLNHAAGTIWDTIEFDKAVGVGREHARRTGRTLVLVTADHDQSMSITGVVDTSVRNPLATPLQNGNTRSSMPYPSAATPAAPAVGGGNPGEVPGFPDYEDADGDGYPENANRLRLAVGFRTANHVGSSVPLTAEGPGALLFTGYYDQTEIFFKTARVLSSDTDPLDRCLEEVRRAQPACTAASVPTGRAR